ncbi:MAG TPA: RluA family pseudouridine synthase [Burkholderiales bacterium]|nr:RluA family pseudouridine synthase [Burkholderiales bacterium]
MNELSKDSATWLEVGEEGDDQRVDNYLTRLLKGVPKSHIYRILRSGEVRVNSGRIGPDHRLRAGDRLRLPPVRSTTRRSGEAKKSGAVAPALAGRIIHEDDALLVIDKPAGVAVHGGSGVSVGAIEQLRRERPQARFLELVHRLDRATSGVLLLAKKRSALTALHAQLREGSAHKFYLTLVKGRWRNAKQNVNLPLHKYVLRSGERRVRVESEGQAAHTIFRLERSFPGFSLLKAELKTGRTHQIRVHLAHLGFPIAGDDKYGDFELNHALFRQGLKRMFLHACRITVVHPVTERRVTYEAPLAPELVAFLATLAPADAHTV